MIVGSLLTVRGQEPAGRYSRDRQTHRMLQIDIYTIWCMLYWTLLSVIPDNETQKVLIRELLCHCYKRLEFSLWKLKWVFAEEKAFWTRILFSTVQSLSRNWGKCSANITHYKIVFQFVLLIRITFYWVLPDIIKCISTLSNYTIPYISYLHFTSINIHLLFLALEISSETMTLRGIRNLHLLPSSVGMYLRVFALILRKVS